jgi:hypothetical protein
MKIIREHLSLFRKQTTDRLVDFLKRNGKDISFREFNDCPSVRTGEGECTVDAISLGDAIGFTSIYVEYSDEYRNFSTHIENLALEDLIDIVECLEAHEQDIIKATEDEATGLFGEAYYEVFGEENGQIMVIDDLNITLENGTHITHIGDWNGEGFELLDSEKKDHWGVIPSGEKLRIAKIVYNTIMTEDATNFNE